MGWLQTVPLLILLAICVAALWLAIRRPETYRAIRPYADCVAGSAFLFLGSQQHQPLTAGLGILFFWFAIHAYRQTQPKW